jgi:DNA-binding NarL/FixJ family response regulator
MLPNMDGLAMLRRLRAQKRFSHTPIFLYTSSETSQVEPLALEAGVTRVFSKSRPAKEVVQAIIDDVAAMQAARVKSPPAVTESEVPHPRQDYRVPVQSETPKLTLRMAEPAPEPPKPKKTPPRPPPPVVEPEEPPPKKGLLARIFRPKED